MLTQQDNYVSVKDASTAFREDSEATQGIPSIREIWSKPLPHLKGAGLTRFLVRGVLSGFRTRLAGVRGLDNVAEAADPFILVLNHSQALEVLLVPALLFFHRDGKRIHFLADWNYRLIPLVDIFYRCGQVITLTRKPAKPKWLNVLKPLYEDKITAVERSERALRLGSSIGVFPEGTINRNPGRLLKGYSGAAQLSLTTGVAVVPGGIRFPQLDPGLQRIPECSPMAVEFGAPLRPPAGIGPEDLDSVREWHGSIMARISQISGKRWSPGTNRK